MPVWSLSRYTSKVTLFLFYRYSRMNGLVNGCIKVNISQLNQPIGDNNLTETRKNLQCLDILSTPSCKVLSGKI